MSKAKRPRTHRKHPNLGSSLDDMERAERMKTALAFIVVGTAPLRRKYLKGAGPDTVYRWVCPGCFMGAGLNFQSEALIEHDLRCVYVLAALALGRIP